MKTKLSQLYETDFNLWLEQTVNHLKKGNLQALDLDNLIEEISDMGRNNRREIFGRLKVLYQKAVRGTVNETNLPKETFPVDCPFTQEQVLNWDYFPENTF